MSRELVPAIDALQRQIEAARKEAAQDPQKARAGLGNAYLAFSSAYDRVAKGLTDVDVPPGLERYHEVLLGGMRKLSSASNDTGRGILTQSEAMTRSGEEKMRNMQASFGKDLESALAGSGYAMDARGSLVKAR